MRKKNNNPVASHENFESIIDGIFQKNYGIAEQFISSQLTEGLRNNLLDNLKQGKMQPAGIGKKLSYAQNLAIRGDVICWIDKDSNNKFEKAFHNQIKDFIQYMNQNCYTGINDFEFHYALYKEGNTYKRHKDQFKNDSGRKFSLVTYLNDNWDQEDGGQLVMYPGKEEIEVMPTGGKSVCFRSNEVEHEVKVSRCNRMSITGWLKNI